ncbi:MAG: hypothetical protein H7Z71_09005 [Moraxellaceae bacterium]|nr:hypothetical protein [Pseudobdellovibrionaceae bacterium]
MKNESIKLVDLSSAPVVLYYSKIFRAAILIITLLTLYTILNQWQDFKEYVLLIIPAALLVIFGIFYSFKYKLILSENEMQETSLFGNKTISISSIAYFKVKISLHAGNESGPVQSLVFYDKEEFSLIKCSDFLENWDQLHSWAKANFSELNS